MGYLRVIYLSEQGSKMTGISAIRELRPFAQAAEAIFVAGIPNNI
jgi:hypothetical protein